MTKATEMFNLQQGIPRVNELDARNLSSTAMHPMPGGISSPRLQMFNGMLPQTVSVVGRNLPIIFSGMEMKYAKYNFPIKFNNNTHVLKVIPKFRQTLSSNSIKDNPSSLVLFEHEIMSATGRMRSEIDCMWINDYCEHHPHFGFKYNHHIKPQAGDRYPAGTVLSTSPSVHESGQYAYGIETGCASITVPPVIEDGVWISEYISEAGATTCIETFSASWGKSKFPLAIHSDNNTGEYQIWPDVGQVVGEDGLLMAFREYNELLAPVIMSAKAVRTLDFKYDDPIHVQPGAKVIDVKIHHDTRVDGSVRGRNPVTPTGMSDQAERYLATHVAFYRSVLEFYSELKRGKGKDGTLNISPRFHRMVVEAQGYCTSGEKDRIVRTHRGVPIDEWRVEITVTYDVKLGIGGKLSGRHGNKGIVTAISPVADMPVDSAGNIAHIVDEPLSVIKRVNPSRDYERYIGASARDTAARIRDRFNKGATKQELSETIIAFYNTIEPRIIPMITTEVSNNTIVTDEEFDNILKHGMSVWMAPDIEKEHIDIGRDLMANFRPVKGPVWYRDTEGTMRLTKKPVLIGSAYFMILEKTGRNFAAVSAAKLGNFGTLSKITSTDRHASPVREQPIRFGESEGRLLIHTIGGDNTAELWDRNNNPAVRKMIIGNIFTADNPMMLENVVDRTVHPRGNSRVVSIARHFNSCGGARFERVELENDKI